MRRSGVALTPGTSAQLTVHTAAFVPLGADDGKTARLFHFGCQLDVGTAAGHVGGDGHLARTSGLGDDLRFQLVLFGVQYVMFDAAQLEHAAQKFRYFDRGGTHEHRTALFDEFDDLLDHGVVFLALGLVNQVLTVVADDLAVGRDDHDIQLVDTPELRCLGFGRTGHTGQLVVHAEVVLQRDGSEGLRRGFDLDALLGFDGLMQPVRIAPAVQNTARLLIDDLHLVVHHHVFDIFLEHRVCFQQLDDRMHALGFDGVVVDYGIALLGLFLRSNLLLLDLGDAGPDVGQDEEALLVEIFRQGFVAFVGEFHRVHLLVDDEVEVVGNLRHAAVVVLHVDIFGLLHLGLDTLFGEELDQRFVLGKTFVAAVELDAALFVLAFAEQLAGFREQVGHQVFLEVVEVLDGRAILFEELVVAFGDGTRNDQRGAGVVD